MDQRTEEDVVEPNVRGNGASDRPKVHVGKSGRTGKRAPRGGQPVPWTARGLDYPRHAVEKALRIPKAILEQNAGKSCSDREAADFSGVGYHGPFRVELSSSLKYGFLSRPKPATVEL